MVQWVRMKCLQIYSKVHYTRAYQEKSPGLAHRTNDTLSFITWSSFDKREKDFILMMFAWRNMRFGISWLGPLIDSRLTTCMLMHNMFDPWYRKQGSMAGFSVLPAVGSGAQTTTIEPSELLLWELKPLLFSILEDIHIYRNDCHIKQCLQYIRWALCSI